MNNFSNKKTVNSIFWSGIDRFSIQGIQFILSIIMARLVTPSDYGLIAILTVLILIAQTFIDGGFYNALIQKQERTETDFSTVFYFNITIALILYAIFFFLSSSISEFYNQPPLQNLTRLIGLNLIISSFSIIQRAKLTIALNFKSQAKISIIAVICSGILGITLAYKGFGVWALAAQSLCSNFANTLLLNLHQKWTPNKPFSINSFKTLFTFGSKLLLSNLIHTIFQNFYTLAIGKKYSSSEVGYYNRSSSLVYYSSTNIMEVISRAVYPIICNIQQDKDHLSNTLLKYLRFSCFIIFPLMTIFSVISEPLINILLTSKWLPAAKFFSILCWANLLTPVIMVNDQIINASGRSDYLLISEIIKKILALIIFIITLPFGIETLCWGLILYSILDVFVVIFFSKKIANTSHKHQIYNILPCLAFSICAAVISYFSMNYLASTSLGKLFAGSFAGFGSYICLCFIFNLNEIKSIRIFISHKKNNPSPKK